MPSGYNRGCCYDFRGGQWTGPAWRASANPAAGEPSTIDWSVEFVRGKALPAAAKAAWTAFPQAAAGKRKVRHVVDGRAVSIERSRVPAIGVVGAAPENGLIDGSLSATMAEAGLITHHGEQWISVAPLGDADARTLGRVPGDLFLHSIRIARDLEGNFVEKVVSWLDPDRFRLHMNFGA